MPKFSKYICFLIVIIFSVSLVSCGKCIDSKTENKNRANVIIGALDEYQQDYLEFPNDLGKLVPDYLKTVPKTCMGKDFRYLTDSVDGFSLSFPVKSKLSCGYTDKYKQWECSFGD